MCPQICFISGVCKIHIFICICTKCNNCISDLQVTKAKKLIKLGADDFYKIQIFFNFLFHFRISRFSHSSDFLSFPHVPDTFVNIFGHTFYRIFANVLPMQTSLSYSYDLAKIILQEVELINMLKLKMILA